MMEQVVYEGSLLAVIIRSGYKNDGIVFFTPDNYSQQLAYMKRPKGYNISPHSHNVLPRVVEYTNEVLFIKSGRIRVDFYDDKHSYVESRVLNSGDIILLSHGGHGFVMLDESEIIEVKQGPYAGEKDKTRFIGIEGEDVKIKD